MTFWFVLATRTALALSGGLTVERLNGGCEQCYKLLMVTQICCMPGAGAMSMDLRAGDKHTSDILKDQER